MIHLWMKLDEFEFMELLVASDLTGNQIEDVVEMYGQSESRFSGKSTAKELKFWIGCRKKLLSDWRAPWSEYVHTVPTEEAKLPSDRRSPNHSSPFRMARSRPQDRAPNF